MARERLTIVMNLKNHNISQYIGFDFNSMVEADGKAYGFNEDGIFLLGQPGDDQGESASPIDAWVTFGTVNFGMSGSYQLRKALLRCRFNGHIGFGVVVDDGNIPKDTIVTRDGDTHRVVALSRNHAGHEFTFSVENLDGEDFEITGIDLLVIPLGRSRYPR